MGKVYAPREGLTKGTRFNFVKMYAEKNDSFRDALPEQGQRGSVVHSWEDHSS
ncbi:hypothetical protein [Polyangium sorediatum]|uniref:Uncharacterized protein n=1 Tax=Polyangium sorediatum TaxID=889274 RepID=A0ABT6P8B5_9BACT|nr:hypothetical protein [Polyangium sorediatum]MDI1436838.1 hypothetical protein [Polyangium sorediatum]